MCRNIPIGYMVLQWLTNKLSDIGQELKLPQQGSGFAKISDIRP